MLFLSFFLHCDTTHQGVWLTTTLTLLAAEFSHQGPLFLERISQI